MTCPSGIKSLYVNMIFYQHTATIQSVPAMWRDEIQAEIDALQQEIDELKGAQDQQDTATSAKDEQTSDNSQTADSGKSSGSSGNTSDGMISLEEAQNIALERVPGATAQDMSIELDRDDGWYIYEGDILYNRMEYEFEIDANTGNILKWEEERW